MKPPHGHKPGGSGRPPSNRGPNAGGGSSNRGPGGGGPSNRGQGGGGGSPNRLSLGASAPGGRDSRGPRPQQGPGQGFQQRSDRPRQDGPRTEGPRHEGPRHEGPRHEGPRHEGPRREAPRGDGPRRDGAQRNERPYREPRPVEAAPVEGRGAYIDGQRVDPNARQGEGGRRGAADVPKGAVWLYGHHAVAAALANPKRRLRRLVMTEEAEGTLAQMLPPPWALQPERTERGRIDQLLGRDIVHQGIALLADTLAQPGLSEVLERPGPLVVLDQVTDPRNVGAILRSAAAFGAAAVIVQDRNAPEENGSLAKAASGTLETMPLLRAVNIARTLIALKAANVWCVGLDAGGKKLSGEFYAGRRVALVLGAEGEGLRRLTRDTCDDIAGLAIKGAVESLNVSAAGAVALYELTRAG